MSILDMDIYHLPDLLFPTIDFLKNVLVPLFFFLLLLFFSSSNSLSSESSLRKLFYEKNMKFMLQECCLLHTDGHSHLIMKVSGYHLTVGWSEDLSCDVFQKHQERWWTHHRWSPPFSIRATFIFTRRDSYNGFKSFLATWSRSPESIPIPGLGFWNQESFQSDNR